LDRWRRILARLTWPQRPASIRWSALAALAASLALVFVFQPADLGFRQGHRGWVSAHTLAIIERATAENRFVGYTMSYAMDDGRELFYFDRYPVFFSAAMHAALHAGELKAGEKIHRARQLMNLIYVATVAMGVLLLLEVGMSVPVAVAASAFAAMGYYLVEYRDMVHFDQPALLGWMVLLWAIAGWYRGRGAARVYLATTFAVLWGRGYASFAVLGVWWLLEAWGAAGREGVRASFRTLLAAAPTRACLLGIGLGAACLAYNISVEASARNVPVTEVSIVDSAARRLSLDAEFHDRIDKYVPWPRLISRQSQSLLRSLMPWRRGNRVREVGMGSVVLALAVAGAAVAFAATRPAPASKVLLLMCLAGPAWIFAMRDLSAFHSYVAIYYFPLTLVFFTALLHLIPPRAHLVAVILACGLGVWSSYRKDVVLTKAGRTAVQETKDMQAVQRELRRRRGIDAVAVAPRHKKLFRGVPFALGFYLPEHDIVADGRTTVVLSRGRGIDGTNLTPNNRRLFLFLADKPYRVRTAIGSRWSSPKGRLARQLRAREETAPE